MSQFLIASFDYEENNIGIMYQNHYYRIYDDGFADYLSKVCAGNSTIDSPFEAETDVAPITGYTEFNAQFVNIRTDVCELYMEVLEDLWNIDPALNDGISQIGIDLSELSHLTELEKETVIHEFASRHNLMYIAGTWEELFEHDYINKDNRYWKDRCFSQ